ncbi:MAG: hypothetical protein LKI67_07355 [Olsenella sp.]|jgi:hypothetical protein|nr:hypothetical protein [Olsenella sp.]
MTAYFQWCEDNVLPAHAGDDPHNKGLDLARVDVLPAYAGMILQSIAGAPRVWRLTPILFFVQSSILLEQKKLLIKHFG